MLHALNGEKIVLMVKPCPIVFVVGLVGIRICSHVFTEDSADKIGQPGGNVVSSKKHVRYCHPALLLRPQVANSG